MGNGGLDCSWDRRRYENLKYNQEIELKGFNILLDVGMQKL